MSLRIKAIIFLMSIALLGLVLIQFYWIDNAIVLKRDEFNQKAVRAIQNVVLKLEKKEMIESIRRHQLGRQMVHDQMMKKRQIILENRGGLAKNKNGFRKFEKNVENGRVTVTEEHSEDSTTRIVTREFKGLRGNSSVQIDVSVNPGSEFFSSQELKLTSDSNILHEKMLNKSAFIDDIIFELMEIDHLKSIEERIDITSLDSMIKSEFKDLMINTDVKFGIFDYFGRIITKTDEVQDVSFLRNSIYKTRLFPNDIFGEPFYLSLYFPNQKSFLLKSMWVTLAVSTVFLLLIVGAFSYTIHVIQNQKQLSLIKNDFISNMTHELKTPISTISLACEALSDEDLTSEPQKKQRFLQMISQENSRLAMLVENVLKSSLWDKSDFELKIEKVDLHKLINEIAETTKMIIEKNNGELTTELNAMNPRVNGDLVHLTNIIHNLLENALKYSPPEVKISIKTYEKENKLFVEIKDNGMGIASDQQKKIFDKFYRIPTGNIHNVKGFGLGLNYVQNVVRSHGGDIEVKSNLGQGSCFTFFIPYNFKSK